ncbi:NEUR3 protein, partial [Amia calva]|nr:NEUR3 protein [Amia calva]
MAPLNQIVFSQEPNGVTYRVPALIYLEEIGTFLAFAEKRSSPADSDAKYLVMRKGKMNGESVQWSPMHELQSVCLPGYRTMSPCPVYDKNNKTLFLFFICVDKTENEQKCSGINAAKLCYVTSQDNGKTWSNITNLTEKVIGQREKDWATFAVGPGHGVQLQSGRLIIPAYAYNICGCKCIGSCCQCKCTPSSCISGCTCYKCECTCCNPTPFAFCIYRDVGQEWKMGNQMPRSQSLECQMAEVLDHQGGKYLYCNARTKSDYRVEAESKNAGEDFEEKKSKLVDVKKSGCQGSVISFPRNDGNSGLLYSHPSSSTDRRQLGIYLNCSPRDPSKWQDPRVIYSGPSGYSDLAYIDGTESFGCLFECGEKDYHEKIVFVKLPINDVMGRTAAETRNV